MERARFSNKTKVTDMTVQTIEINQSTPFVAPKMRLTGTPLANVWEYVGYSLRSEGTDGRAGRRDLNQIVQIAAHDLAQKVTGRSVSVELEIDPLIPELSAFDETVLKICRQLADNASASVEPGPGTVVLRTWWKGRHVGIDAVGLGGTIPREIRDSILRPGFSTRVASWDTGFGLHDALCSAGAIGARINIIPDKDGVRFRVAIPLKTSTPKLPPEKQVALDNEINEGLSTKPSKLEELTCDAVWMEEMPHASGQGTRRKRPDR